MAILLACCMVSIKVADTARSRLSKVAASASVQGMVRYLRNARMAKDIDLHPERDG